MNRTRRTIAGIIAACAIAPTVALAMTGGEPDGNRHPNVGMIAFYQDGTRYRCTGTLVSPTVVLTAAHCTLGTAGKTIVTFDTFIAAQAPSGLPTAANPTAGFTAQDVTDPRFVTGVAHTHPNYSDFTDIKNWNDVGVVVLDAPLRAIAPASIAPTGYLDQFAQPVLNSTLFTIVGYGTEVRKPDSGPQKPTPQGFPLIRRFADAPGQKLTPQILQVNGNPNDLRGTGGSCFGDSGGPTFKNAKVVTVTSYGYTANCRYLDGLQRVDIPVVQRWLAGFGVRP